MQACGISGSYVFGYLGFNLSALGICIRPTTLQFDIFLVGCASVCIGTSPYVTNPTTNPHNFDKLRLGALVFSKFVTGLRGFLLSAVPLCLPLSTSNCAVHHLHNRPQQTAVYARWRRQNYPLLGTAPDGYLRRTSKSVGVGAGS